MNTPIGYYAKAEKNSTPLPPDFFERLAAFDKSLAERAYIQPKGNGRI
jgi:hypothetical protein